MRAIVTANGAGVEIVDDVATVLEAGDVVTLKNGAAVTVATYLRADVAKIELV